MSIILYFIEIFTQFIANYVLFPIIIIFGFNFIIDFIRKYLLECELSSEGKAVLITGCDSGFGNRLALRLNRIGFRVYATVLDTNNTGAQELHTKALNGKNMLVLEMDVTNDSQVKEVYETVKQDLENSGHIFWAVVNNAGILLPGRLDWGKLDQFTKHFEVNVLGTVRVTRVFLPLIKASKGRITNVASVLGRVSLHYLGAYCMSKHSVIAFSDALRREIYKFGVNVSIIEPASFRTSLIAENNLRKLLDQLYDQGSNDVKKQYNIEKEKKFFLDILKMLSIEDNLDLVINDIVHSLQNRWPKAYYSPMGLINKILYWLIFFIPSVTIDWILILLDKIMG